MKVAGLFSGGKDSTFAIYKAKSEGHQVACLITVLPLSEESTLLHFPNISITKLQSKSMNIPHFFIKSNSNEIENEIHLLKDILKKAKIEFGIKGVVHGGLKSQFQKNKFQDVCKALNLKLISPLWNTHPLKYMKDLIESKIRFIIVSVSAEGLDDSWLGKEISLDELEKLKKLSEKHRFNLNFEGGEAESLVIDCPLFSYPIKITKSKKIWDGYRGRFEILEAKLDNYAR
jgi:ABC transporter with metal-binding/Fe-S-binding domain ATP-binding protein